MQAVSLDAVCNGINNESSIWELFEVLLTYWKILLLFSVILPSSLAD